MALDWLKTILGDAYTEEIDTKVSKEIGTSFVSKADFNGVNTEKKRLEDEVKTRDGQLETLKNSTGDVEGLKKQVADLQAGNEGKDKAHAAEIKQLKVITAVDAALAVAKAKNSKAVKALLDLDMENVELGDDGRVKGLDDKIKQLQGAEDSKFLFDTDTKKTTVKGAKPGETGKEKPDDKVDTSKMSYEELATFLEQNPDAEI